MIFTAQDVKSRLKDRPFVPAQIVTTAGREYNIYHPDLVFVGYSFVIIGTASPNDPALADAVTRVPLAHVSEIRDLPAPAAVPDVADV